MSLAPSASCSVREIIANHAVVDAVAVPLLPALAAAAFPRIVPFLLRLVCLAEQQAEPGYELGMH